jgi:aryl-alcohol dehydrogenase-like predicted oxidoreductase
MRYRKLGSSDLEVSEISLGAWLTFAGGVTLTPDTRAAIGQALGDAPVKEPTPAPFARPGITHR